MSDDDQRDARKVDTAPEFLLKRSDGGSLQGLREILDRVPANPPDELDRLD